jgi:hypothetical protein
MKDPIVEEVRPAREAHAKQFNYELDAIGENLRRPPVIPRSRFLPNGWQGEGRLHK